MNKKTPILLISLILILILSACQLGADDYQSGDPAKQPHNPQEVPTPTPEPSPAILANSGTHRYTVTATPLTCELTLTDSEKTMNIVFEGTTAILTNEDKGTSETYGIAGEDRYSRINDSFKTIVVLFSTQGYVLQIFEPEADPWVDEPCGYFTHTLLGD
ncbi:MAG: hypothetical protein JW757_13200 [Anaerolineales bacterium]|nr:hypothetical protein [Anaerolineales bacterium]